MLDLIKGPYFIQALNLCECLRFA